MHTCDLPKGVHLSSELAKIGLRETNERVISATTDVFRHCGVFRGNRLESIGVTCNWWIRVDVKRTLSTSLVRLFGPERTS